MNISAIEVCKRDLYTSRDELLQKYPLATVEKVLRVREMHQWMVANPTKKDREFIEEHTCRFAKSEQIAYMELRIIKQLLPSLVKSSKAYERWKYNEMIQETYAMAKAEGDLKTMERAATSYARNNNVSADSDEEEDYRGPVPQPFTATMDPRVLGLSPIPNLDAKIKELTEKYARETADIEDVDYEEADLEEEKLFPAIETMQDGIDSDI